MFDKHFIRIKPLLKNIIKLKPPKNLTDPVPIGYKWFMGICMVLLLIQAIFEAQHDGDLVGYIAAGQAVLDGHNIYLDYLNTWPPFFSIVAVPLTLAYQVAPYLVKLIWILGNLAALFICMKIGVLLFLKRRLLLPFQKSTESKDLVFHHPIILIPLLLVLRLVIEHNSHLQINLYMMALAMLSLYFFYKNKPEWAGLVLGLSIAIKVYTILILFYFLYKRAHQVVIYALLTIAICVATTVLVFGIDLATYYHELWWVKNSIPRKPATHMNQGLLATALRYFTSEDTGLTLQINVFDYTFSAVKRSYYIMVLGIAVIPAWLFRKKLLPTDLNIGTALQWGIVFSIIPLLSPVGWKYYYVFMWMPYFLVNYVLFNRKAIANKTAEILAKTIFYFSVFCLTFSSELFVGPKISDLLEVYGVVTWGGVGIVMVLFLLYFNLSSEQRNSPLWELK